jgi:hypothetical protein
MELCGLAMRPDQHPSDDLCPVALFLFVRFVSDPFPAAILLRLVEGALIGSPRFPGLRGQFAERDFGAGLFFHITSLLSFISDYHFFKPRALSFRLAGLKPILSGNLSSPERLWTSRNDRKSSTYLTINSAIIYLNAVIPRLDPPIKSEHDIFHLYNCQNDNGFSPTPFTGQNHLTQTQSTTSAIPLPGP